MTIPGLDRLGIGSLLADHARTLRRLDDRGQPRVSVADWAVLLVLPVAVAAGLALVGVRVHSVAALVPGTSIMAGAMLTLLVTLFGVQVVGTQLGGSDRIRLLIRETRATIAYAFVVSLVSAYFYMAVDSASPPPVPAVPATPTLPAVPAEPVSSPGILVTVIAFSLLGHLLLVLLMALNRVRLAFDRLPETSPS